MLRLRPIALAFSVLAANLATGSAPVAALPPVEVSSLTDELDGAVGGLSLGEAYLAADRRKDSIASYRRSLELDPRNRNAEEKLRELGVEP